MYHSDRLLSTARKWEARALALMHGGAQSQAAGRIYSDCAAEIRAVLCDAPLEEWVKKDWEQNRKGGKGK